MMYFKRILGWHTCQRPGSLWQEKEVGKLLGGRQVCFEQFAEVMHICICNDATTSCSLMQVL